MTRDPDKELIIFGSPVKRAAATSSWGSWFKSWCCQILYFLFFNYSWYSKDRFWRINLSFISQLKHPWWRGWLGRPPKCGGYKVMFRWLIKILIIADILLTCCDPLFLGRCFHLKANYSLMKEVIGYTSEMCWFLDDSIMTNKIVSFSYISDVLFSPLLSLLMYWGPIFAY